MSSPGPLISYRAEWPESMCGLSLGTKSGKRQEAHFVLQIYFAPCQCDLVLSILARPDEYETDRKEIPAIQTISAASVNKQ